MQQMRVIKSSGTGLPLARESPRPVGGKLQPANRDTKRSSTRAVSVISKRTQVTYEYPKPSFSNTINHTPSPLSTASRLRNHSQFISPCTDSVAAAHWRRPLPHPRFELAPFRDQQTRFASRSLPTETDGRAHLQVSPTARLQSIAQQQRRALSIHEYRSADLLRQVRLRPPRVCSPACPTRPKR
jgi:hypothetical protein